MTYERTLLENQLFKNYFDNIGKKYKTRLTQNTRENIASLYNLKNEIIKLSDGKTPPIKSRIWSCR